MRRAGLFISICMLLGSSAFAAVITKGPYLMYAGSSGSMTVLWQTDAAQSCTLQWGTDTSYTGGSVSSTEINTAHQHKKSITGLAAGTLYYYKVTVGSATHTGSFKAAPSSTATDVKFLVYGDTRTNPGYHNTVASRMVSTMNADSGYQTLALHVGDFVESGENESDWTSQFFPRSQSSILSMQSKVAIQGTRGNHEGNGSLFKKYFPYPFAADGYWAFDYGPMHVSVVDQCVLDRGDSGFNLSSTQFNWLTNDLAKTSKKWKVILVHHPGYSAGGHVNNTYLINTLRPQFEKYKVTAVFGGHNHYYARAVRNGIHYVTTGGGGASKTSVPDTSDSYIVTGTKGLQFCKVAISGNSFNCKSVAAETGNVIDDFTVTNSNGGVTVPSVSFAVPAGNATVQQGTNLYIKVNATDPDGISQVRLYKNGVRLARTEGGAPYEWCAPGQNDPELQNLQPGSFTLRAEAVDSVNTTGTSSTITITVQGSGNQAPYFTADPFTMPDATAGTAYSQSISAKAVDPEGGTKTFSKTAGPEWLSISSAGAAQGTPGSVDVGANSFMVKVTDDGGLSDTATLNINVLAAQSGIPAVGSIITLKACNGKYVSATYSTNNTLIADKTTVSNYERFKVINATNCVALQCMGNSKFVSINVPNGSKPMVADRPGIGSYEKFKFVESGTQVAIQAVLSTNYVSAVSNGVAPLRACQTYVGSYEKFTWAVE